MSYRTTDPRHPITRSIVPVAAKEFRRLLAEFRAFALQNGEREVVLIGLEEMLTDIDGKLDTHIRNALSSQNGVARDIVGRVGDLAQRVHEIPAALGALQRRIDDHEANHAQIAAALTEIRDAVAEVRREGTRLHSATLDELWQARTTDRNQAREQLATEREIMRKLIERASRQNQILMLLMVVSLWALVAFRLQR